MKKIVLTTLILLLIGSVNILCAQVAKDKPDLIKKEKLPEAKPGTYQFIYYPSKLKFIFTNETLMEIEKQRDAKIDKYIWLTPTVQVRILSKEYIESSDFVPLAEKKYVD